MSARTILFAVPLLLTSALASATGAGGGLPHATVDMGDASLQRGARLFVNYCLSCHSAAYMRYNRIAQDLHIPEKAVAENLMFTGDKLGAPMEVAMRPGDAEQWLGVAPPDLSTVARSRGADWLYGYLTTFYLDPKRPSGVNNLVFKGTGMPHVLWELQGFQRIVPGTETAAVPKLEQAVPGKLDEAQYHQSANDLVSFLVYMAEPAQLERKRYGLWVLAFLGFLTVVLYQLKQEYWKDVH